MKTRFLTFFITALLFLIWTGLVIAQESVSSNKVVTKVGNPTEPEPQVDAGSGGKITPDGKHACPLNVKYVPFKSYTAIKQDEFSFACGHAGPIYNAIDIGTYPGGGTEAIAVVDGMVEDLTNPGSGPSLFLKGDDGWFYFYGHLQSTGLVTGRIKVGQRIGYVARAGEAANNGTAHIHFERSTDPNKHNKGNPTNDPAGVFLDEVCGINVCNGKPGSRY